MNPDLEQIKQALEQAMKQAFEERPKTFVAFLQVDVFHKKMNMSNDKYPKLSEYFDMYNPMFLSEETLETITDIVLEEAGFKWIPVSERLPEEGKMFYQVTLNRNGIIALGWIFFSGKTWVTTFEVLAWMPRPKPYDPKP